MVLSKIYLISFFNHFGSFLACKHLKTRKMFENIGKKVFRPAFGSPSARKLVEILNTLHLLWQIPNESCFVFSYNAIAAELRDKSDSSSSSSDSSDEENWLSRRWVSIFSQTQQNLTNGDSKNLNKKQFWDQGNGNLKRFYTHCVLRLLW